MESHYNRRRKCIDGSPGIKLKGKMIEKHNSKEDFKQAKEDEYQSARSNIQSQLETKSIKSKREEELKAKYQSERSNIIASELELQLETTKARIRSKREEELKATTQIKEINDKLDNTCKYIDQLKMKIFEESRKKSELKQALLMRKQTLEALQLTHRALLFEIEASRASASHALQYICRSQNDDTTTKLTVAKYNALTRAANEEISLNDWRVSVSTEQRLAAQDSRDSAFKILEGLYSKHVKTEDDIREDRSSGRQDEKEHLQIIEEEKDPEIKCPTRSPQHLVDVTEHSDDTNLAPIRKKPSVLAHIRIFLKQNCA